MVNAFDVETTEHGSFELSRSPVGSGGVALRSGHPPNVVSIVAQSGFMILGEGHEFQCLHEKESLTSAVSDGAGAVGNLALQLKHFPAKGDGGERVQDGVDAAVDRQHENRDPRVQAFCMKPVWRTFSSVKN